MGDLPRLGRPPKDDNERLNALLKVRMREDDKLRIEAHAKRLGRPTSEWARETLLRSLNRSNKVEK